MRHFVEQFQSWTLTGRLLSIQFLKKLWKRFISKPVHVTSLIIFIPLLRESISQYLLHPCEFKSPHSHSSFELRWWASWARTATITDRLIFLHYVCRTRNPWVNRLPLLLITLICSKALSQPTAQVTGGSTFPLQEGAQYSFVVQAEHKTANQEGNIFRHRCLPWGRPLISASPEQLCL